MSLRRTALPFVVAAVSACVLAVPWLSTANAGSPATYLTADCVHPTTQPKSVVLYCGDGNQFFTKLSWQRWGTSVAEGLGTLNVNTCTPNCAAGHTVTAKANLTVTDPKACGASHRRQYTKWAVTILGTPPKGVQPNSYGSFLCK